MDFEVVTLSGADSLTEHIYRFRAASSLGGGKLEIKLVGYLERDRPSRRHRTYRIIGQWDHGESSPFRLWKYVPRPTPPPLVRSMAEREFTKRVQFPWSA